MCNKFRNGYSKWSNYRWKKINYNKNIEKEEKIWKNLEDLK